MKLVIIILLLAPFLWAFINILDKYILVKKVKNPLSYSVVSGISALIISLVLSFFLNWQNITLKAFIFPGIAGAIASFNVFVYYYMMKKEDASYVIGFAYTYPIILSVLSFLFLRELIPLTGYIGMILIIFGVLMLSIRMKKIKMVIAVWTIFSIILFTALSEFFVKLSTYSIPVWNGIAVHEAVYGLFALLAFLVPSIRKGFTREAKNFGWAISDSLIFLGCNFTLYYTMLNLPATVVASVSAIQPLAVLIYERIADKMFGEMKRDHLLLPKLGAIALIVAGVVLITISTGYK